MKSKKWTALIVSSLILSGCVSNKWDDVPLEASDIPFQIPAGVYEDVEGTPHKVDVPSWVLNNGELYDFIQWLKKDRQEINNVDKE